MNTNIDLVKGNAPARGDGGPAQSPAESSLHGGTPTTGTPPEGPKPRFGWLVVLVILLLGGAFALGLFPRLKQREAVLAETRDNAIVTVNVTNPSPAKSAPPLVLSGELRPSVETAIYARASGFVRKWTADIGAHVEQGQLLAELDTPELNRDLAQSRAELTQAEAAAALSESTAKRWREMLITKAVSAQDADEKNADYDLKRATVEASRARVQRLEDVLGYSKIMAPFSGTITVRRLDVGQLVNAGGSQELFRLAQTEKLRLFVRVPQSYARAVAVGQNAELALPEIPGRKFTGKVVRTAGAVDASSRTLLTEIEVDNSKGELLAGSYSQVRLAESHPDAALTLPSNCLLFRPEGTQVALVVNGHATMRPVTLGRDFGATVEILSGVTSADQAIVNPADSIVDGLEVRVAPPPKPAAP